MTAWEMMISQLDKAITLQPIHKRKLGRKWRAGSLKKLLKASQFRSGKGLMLLWSRRAARIKSARSYLDQLDVLKANSSQLPKVLKLAWAVAAVPGLRWIPGTPMENTNWCLARLAKIGISL